MWRYFVYFSLKKELYSRRVASILIGLYALWRNQSLKGKFGRLCFLGTLLPTIVACIDDASDVGWFSNLGFTIFVDAKRVPNVSTKFGSISINVATAPIFPTENAVTFYVCGLKRRKIWSECRREWRYYKLRWSSWYIAMRKLLFIPL